MIDGQAFAREAQRVMADVVQRVGGVLHDAAAAMGINLDQVASGIVGIGVSLLVGLLVMDMAGGKMG